jgi:hypothetical protein
MYNAFDTKTDNAAGEHIHDQQHPVTAQEDRSAGSGAAAGVG